MNPADSFFARIALARGWISRAIHDEALRRVQEMQARGLTKTVEDVLRESGELDEERLRVLRRLLSRYTRQARIGDYIIVRRIGVGGTGMVFEARHRRIGRRVALKVLLPRLEKEPGFTERFLREARSLARIDHPNVVHAYDAGKDGVFHFIAMELVLGENLSSILKREGALPAPRSLEILEPVARALAAIHGAGLVHRDVKPANILIGADRSVKLVDLGLFLSETDRRVLWEGMVFGTPHYMAPEQVRGDPTIDSRADLYAYGATWYHVLTGRPPFTGESPQEIAAAHLEAVPAPPRRLRPEIPESIDGLVLRLLRKLPEERLASAAELAAALSLLRHPGAPPPPTPAPRPAPAARPGARALGRRFRGARPSLAAAAGAGVLLAAAAIGALSMRTCRKPEDGAPRGLPAVLSAAADTEAGPAIGESAGTAPAQLSSQALPELADRLERGWEIGFSGVRTVSERTLEALRAAVPTFLDPRSHFRGRRTQAPAASAAPAAAEAAISPAALPEAPPALPEPIAAWAESAAAEARRRFRERLAGLEPGARVTMIVETGGEARPVAVRVDRALEGPRLLEAGSGAPVAIERLHAASVLAWSALSGSGGDPVDRGAGYALAAGRPDLARRILRALDARIPEEARVYLAAISPGIPGRQDSAAAERQFEDALVWAARVEMARAAFEGGAWQEARSAYDALASERRLPESLHREPELWTRRRDRAGALYWLTAQLFRGTAAAIDPLNSTAISLRYPFDAPAELEDFRWQPRRWALRDGRAVHTGGDPREPLEMIAIFRLPLAVEGRWTPPAPRSRGEARGRLAIAFDDLGIGYGGAEGPFAIFRAGTPEERAFLAGAPTGAGGEFRLEIQPERIIAVLPGGVRIDTSTGGAAPDFGRVAVLLEPGASLDELRIAGQVDPTWSRSRIEHLKARPQAGKR